MSFSVRCGWGLGFILHLEASRYDSLPRHRVFSGGGFQRGLQEIGLCTGFGFETLFVAGGSGILHAGAFRGVLAI